MTSPLEVIGAAISPQSITRSGTDSQLKQAYGRDARATSSPFFRTFVCSCGRVFAVADCQMLRHR